jgi:N-acetylglucosamine kinase-like BadF-type ATPase
MNQKVYLGIDGGGTKTAAVLLDSDGCEIARGTSGPSNLHSVGWFAAESALHDAIYRALDSARLTPSKVTATGLGMAGAARPDDVLKIREMASRIGPFRNLLITHDAEAALVGGVGRRHGAVLIAGTGAIAYAVNALGETARADGWGYLMGDEGSAYWIGLEGLKAIARAHDDRGPATTLTARILDHFGVADLDRLVKPVYAEEFGVPQLAGLAPLVRQAAQQGDRVAELILRDAGQRLSAALRAVIRRLNMTDEVFDVLLLGGVLRVRDLVWETVATDLARAAPRATIVEPRHDAAFGAALLAMQRED